MSDKLVGPDRIALPSLIAVGAVHQHLLRTKQRPKVGVLSMQSLVFCQLGFGGVLTLFLALPSGCHFC